MTNVISAMSSMLSHLMTHLFINVFALAVEQAVEQLDRCLADVIRAVLALQVWLTAHREHNACTCRPALAQQDITTLPLLSRIQNTYILSCGMRCSHHVPDRLFQASMQQQILIGKCRDEAVHRKKA